MKLLQPINEKEQKKRLSRVYLCKDIKKKYEQNIYKRKKKGCWRKTKKEKVKYRYEKETKKTKFKKRKKMLMKMLHKSSKTYVGGE